MNFKFNPTLLLILTLISSSCQYDPYAHEYTTKKPDPSDIIGTYVLHAQTVEYPVKAFLEPGTNEIVNPTIQVNRDGTYGMKNVPNFEGRFDIEFKGLVNSTGEWTIETIGSVGDGAGEIKKYWGMRLSQTTENLESVGFMDSEAPYRLIFRYGDHDEGKAMIFKKVDD